MLHSAFLPGAELCVAARVAARSTEMSLLKEITSRRFSRTLEKHWVSFHLASPSPLLLSGLLMPDMGLHA